MIQPTHCDCGACDPDVLAIAAAHDASMKTAIVGNYEIEQSDEGINIIHGQSNSLVDAAYEFALDIIKMRELLNAVNESTGPGASEDQLPAALRAVSEYIDSLPK